MRVFLGSLGLGALGDFLGGARRLAYVPTAVKPMEEAKAASWEALHELGYELDVLPVEEADRARIASAVESADAVFVDGGSPFFLLQAMRESGFHRIAVDAVRAGKPYVGMSAGAVVAGPDIEPFSLTSNTSLGPRLDSTEGLGLAEFVVYPHYSSPERAAPFAELVAKYGARYRLLPLGDEQALIVDDEGPRVVAS